MDSEKDFLLSLGDSVPSSPNAPLVQPSINKEDTGMGTVNTNYPLQVPEIEIEAGTPEKVSPSRQRSDRDVDHSRLNHSGSRNSLSKTFSHQQRKKEQRRQKSSQLPTQLPAHGEVQRMEQSLLKLLQEFNSGELRGFDSAYSLDEMESVRDQQEALARKHFELGAQQDLHPLLSDDGLELARENMSQLIASLEMLSHAIGNLSCLDRMVDPGARLVDEVDHDSNLSHERGKLVRGDTNQSSREESSQYSRRSTMSNQTGSTNMPDEEVIFVPTIIQENSEHPDDIATAKLDLV